MQCRAPAERKALLKGSLDELGLESGYQAVARLAKAGYFNLILTLNVDDAIDDAVSPLPAQQRMLLVYNGSNAAQIIAVVSLTTPRIKVVKLRGDINTQALPLTATGQFEFPEDLERSVSEWLKRDMILVGDIPYDTDVQRCIKQSPGALWCILPDEPASNSFTMRAKQVRPAGEIITGADAEFNKFFTALAVALEKDVACAVEPTPSVVRQPRRIDAAANQDWQRMITACHEIISIAPFYRDVQRLLRKGRFHSARQRAGAIWARYKATIGMLAVLLLMVTGISVLGKRIVSVWQPTPMPPTPQVSVEAFLIKKGETPTVTVKPDTTITATVHEIVQVKAEVSTTYEEQEKDLAFTWYTCRTGSSPVRQRIGNPEMLYVAPSEPGADCICVVIEKGGVLLDRSEIFVDVQE